MNKRPTILLAWGLGFAGLVIAGIGFFFLALNYLFPQVADVSALLNDGTGLVQGLVFACLGAFLVYQRPQHPISWLMLVMGLSGELSQVSAEYSLYTMVTRPGGLPGGIWVTWLQQWDWIPFVTSFAMILLFFPTGHLMSPRWNWLVYALIAASGVLWLVALFASPLYVNNDPNHSVPNPISTFSPSFQNDLAVFLNNGLLLYLLLSIPSLVMIVRRFRLAQGIEREQMKWFAYAALFSMLIIFVGNQLSLFGSWSQAVVNLGMTSPAIAIAIAILKYRLYDIDVLIRRTLIYGVLTLLLASIYFGSVVILQELFRSLTGQTSYLAIILSTLAIAALFSPLRRRAQTIIDHRFYRQKYDAQQVLERFAITVRDEVELEKLSGELLNVVHETMQPTSVSLWLRKIGDN